MARAERPAGDPFAVLGLSPDADATAISRARRRLARELHPDRGGDEGRMQALNAAFDQAMALVATKAAARGNPPVSGPATAPATAPTAAGAAGPTPSDPRAPEPGGGRRWVERDEPSFVIEALPVEAFEALVVVASWMGDLLIDEPPYLMEVHVQDPAPCWCRLELLPEAGATTVMLTVVGIEGVTPPIEAVRDAWIANLNRL